MDKFWRAEAMLREASPPGLRFVDAEPAPLDALLRVHEEGYLGRIRSAGLAPIEALKLGLPAGEALFERSRLEAGGTLLAAGAALADGLAANLAGGTHHAHADRGLGYCVLNDVAIAVRALQAVRPALRVLVVDTDAHHGDGTAALFAGDARVFTYSIHVGRNYPSFKPPGSLDVPLARWAGGVDYLDQLEATLPPAIEEQRPDLVFWISGADPHERDRFGQLRLSDADMEARDAFVLHELCRCRGLPVVVLYGGGYNHDRVHTARLHARSVLAAAALS